MPESGGCVRRTNQTEGEPTPAEIAERAAEIRAGWSEAEHAIDRDSAGSKDHPTMRNVLFFTTVAMLAHLLGWDVAARLRDPDNWPSYAALFAVVLFGALVSLQLESLRRQLEETTKKLEPHSRPSDDVEREDDGEAGRELH